SRRCNVVEKQIWEHCARRLKFQIAIKILSILTHHPVNARKKTIHLKQKIRPLPFSFDAMERGRERSWGVLQLREKL
ncbi:MAG: hypothetical protein LBG58_06510, partial [Planctomycetaceae bacterium]|nr:hypothetical protein [Planctomycetaceae bacterium]